jgi:hypothetical protein
LSKTITYQEWEDTYLPITNPITGDCKTDYSFETYGEELDYIRSHDEHNVWTEMDGDNGVYIVSGYHLVNRIQYYVTDVAWTEDIEIVVCEYLDCDCIAEGEGNPDCNECNGDGTKTVWGD